MSLSGYTVLDRSSDSTSGGVALLINQNTLSSPVDLDTNLQAVAARISCGKTVTVCSIYLPPSVPVRGTDLYHLFEQLPCPFIVVGDYAVTTLCGGVTIVIVEVVCLKRFLMILTYVF